MHLFYFILILSCIYHVCSFLCPRLSSNSRCQSHHRHIASTFIRSKPVIYKPCRSFSRIYFGKKVSDDDILHDESEVDDESLDEDIEEEPTDFDILNDDFVKPNAIVDDNDDDDMDEDEDKERLPGAEERTDAWSVRRKNAAKERELKLSKRKTWEEQFNDNPYTSNEATENWEPEADRFEKWYLAMASVEGEDMTDLRSEAWTHHMQWVRRTVLHPRNNISIAWDYTRLSSDYMNVEGQVIAFRANHSDKVFDLLKREPLAIHGGVQPWRVYEMDVFDHNNTDWYFTDPIIFIGSGSIDEKKWLSTSQESKAYHSDPHTGIRVTQLAYLNDISPSSNSSGTKDKKGVLITFNSKTIRNAQKYVSNDPLLKNGLISESILSPMNIQDVSGLHHLMPRSFSQLQDLQQIHYMDPEDLLKLQVDVLPGLEHHARDNKNTLSALKAMNISHAYTRWSISERFDNTIPNDVNKRWNEYIIKAQSVRLRGTDGMGGADGAFEDMAVEEMGSED